MRDLASAPRQNEVLADFAETEGGRQDLRKTLTLARKRASGVLASPVASEDLATVDSKLVAASQTVLARLAQTRKLSPVKEEHESEQVASRFPDLFAHTTPRAYVGPLDGAIDRNTIQPRLLALAYATSAGDLTAVIVQGIEMVSQAHNNLLALDAITLPARLEPTLDEIRQELGDLVPTLEGYLQQLEADLQAIGRKIATNGSEAIVRKDGWRSETFITELTAVTQGMVDQYKTFARDQLFPQMTDRTAVEKEATRYRELNQLVVTVLTGGEDQMAELSTWLQKTEMSLQAQEQFPRYIAELKEQHQQELDSSRTEELAEHIVENALTLELQALLERKAGGESIEANVIAQKFKVLVCYFLRHLRNSLGGPLATILMDDDMAKNLPDGIQGRLIDWKDPKDQLSDGRHRIQVVIALLMLFYKCLRALRITRYQRAFMKTLPL